MKIARTAPTRRCLAALSASLVAVALALAGCSHADHQIVTQGCADCHGDVPQTYEVEDPEGAVKSCGAVVVRAEGEVAVCEPRFTDEKGASYVPVSRSVCKAVDGTVTLALEPGVWAICQDDGDGGSVGKLVIVSQDCTEVPTVKLK